jgi:hypothetical protein
MEGKWLVCNMCVENHGGDLLSSYSAKVRKGRKDQRLSSRKKEMGRGQYPMHWRDGGRQCDVQFGWESRMRPAAAHVNTKNTTTREKYKMRTRKKKMKEGIAMAALSG